MEIKAITLDKLKNSLTFKIAPLADRLRQLGVELGIRTYSVTIIAKEWKNGYKGDGNYEIISMTEILPYPKIEKIIDIHRVADWMGMVEEGDVLVSQISIDRYNYYDLTKENLKSRDGVEIYYEIKDISLPDVPVEKFVLISKPFKNIQKLEWQLLLRKTR